MPELPEVEVIRRQLEPLAGRSVVGAWARPEDRWASSGEVRGRLERFGRRGKFLVWHLDADPACLVVHLGMTGRLDLVDDGADRDRHACASWVLDDGRRLELCDPRRFGRAVACDDPDDVLPPLGPEPLDDGFDLDAFARAVAGRTRGAKDLLLSQQLVAGPGNYLCDESLWRSRLHPEARGLTVDEGRRLGAALVDLMHESVAAGGASLRDYRSLAGAGRTQDLLECYGHAGEPCRRCGTVLARSKVAGRGTTSCPTCQPARRGAGS